jgi:hypothetical protein
MLQNILTIVSSLSVLLVSLLPVIRAYLLANKTGRKREATQFLLDLTETAILQLEPTVRNLKDPKTAGEWNTKSAAQVRDLALNYVKKKGLEELTFLAENAKGETVDDILHSIYEAQVEKVKRARLNREVLNQLPAS